MKHFLFLLPLLFLSCGEKTYDVVVKNNSASKTVSYSYNGLTHSLANGTSERFDVKASTQAPTNVKVMPDGSPLSVKMTFGHDEYTFVDVDPINLTVTNTLAFSVTIKAGEYISGDSSGTTITLNAGAVSSNAKIYTSQPIFTTTPYGNLNSVVWYMDGATMIATIKSP